MIANLAAQNIKDASPTPPKQAKLLGATVKGIGVITTVDAYLPDCFALIEDAEGKEHHCFIKHLKKEQVAFPSQPQPYRATRRLISYGLWADVLKLVADAVDTPRAA